MKLNLDPDLLTFGDLEDFEELTGSPLMAVFEQLPETGLASIRGKDIVGLVWICGRMSNPDFTVDDARKVRFSDVEVEVGSADPTDGGDSPS